MAMDRTVRQRAAVSKRTAWAHHLQILDQLLAKNITPLISMRPARIPTRASRSANSPISLAIHLRRLSDLSSDTESLKLSGRDISVCSVLLTAVLTT
jgi:hypothetical protein